MAQQLYFIKKNKIQMLNYKQNFCVLIYRDKEPNHVLPKVLLVKETFLFHGKPSLSLCSNKSASEEP
jgi:hypothetical protein